MPVEPMRTSSGADGARGAGGDVCRTVASCQTGVYMLFVQHASQAVGGMDRWVVPSFLFLPKEGK